MHWDSFWLGVGACQLFWFLVLALVFWRACRGAWEVPGTFEEDREQ